MKETLDEQSRQDLIQYRLQRADETMEEVVAMAQMAHYNAAISRMYYACYYATIALLLKNRISATTHAGVKTMLGLHFVSKGILTNLHGRTLTPYSRNGIAATTKISSIAISNWWMNSCLWPKNTSRP